LAIAVVLLLIAGSKVGPRADAEEPAHEAERKVASLSGRVLYDGTPPAPGELQIPLRIGYFRDGRQKFSDELPERRQVQARGVPDESIIVGKGGGIANVIVWLRSRDVRTGPHRGPVPRARLRAVDGRFEPHVLAVWIKSPLVLSNESTAAINFNLQGQAQNRVVAAGQNIEISLKKPDAAPTRVRSNIQPWYSAYILPLSHPYSAVTGSDGRFEIKNVLIGEWEFAIWHERSGWLRTDQFPSGRFKLRIAPGENNFGDLLVDPQTLAERTK
jgi:hypothetical protein